ncbi:3191_t:CDS:1, partial [Entrophospora sp. SA101]
EALIALFTIVLDSSLEIQGSSSITWKITEEAVICSNGDSVRPFGIIR